LRTCPTLLRCSKQFAPSLGIQAALQNRIDLPRDFIQIWRHARRRRRLRRVGPAFVRARLGDGFGASRRFAARRRRGSREQVWNTAALRAHPIRQRPPRLRQFVCRPRKRFFRACPQALDRRIARRKRQTGLGRRPLNRLARLAFKLKRFASHLNRECIPRDRRFPGHERNARGWRHKSWVGAARNPGESFNRRIRQ
jgi:hypothetical protein